MSRYLLNAARTFIFSPAPPPPVLAGALAALDLLEECPRRVQKLAANAAALRKTLVEEGLDTAQSQTQIVSVMIGDCGRVAGICAAALAQGIFVQAIQPPTVAPLATRVRLTVMATHREEELRDAARTLAAAARSAGIQREGQVGSETAVPHEDSAEPVPLDRREGGGRAGRRV